MLYHLVYVRAEEWLALELDVGHVAGFWALDVDFTTELYPRYSKNRASIGARESCYIFFV
jgi:hypothetical protein